MSDRPQSIGQAHRIIVQLKARIKELEATEDALCTEVNDLNYHIHRYETHEWHPIMWIEGYMYGRDEPYHVAKQVYDEWFNTDRIRNLMKGESK